MINTEQILETDAIDLGFELDRHYEHDDWETLKYKKGPITIGFTYTLGLKELESVTVDIDEVNSLEIGKTALTILSVILK